MYPSCPAYHSPSQVAKLPFVINDGKWHHICITWTTRDGVWEAYQDGTQGGNGENLAPYHPIKPQGVLVLGQEQVLAMGEASGEAGCGGRSSRTRDQAGGRRVGGLGGRGSEEGVEREVVSPDERLRETSYAAVWVKSLL